MATLTTRVTALESDVTEIKAGVQAILAALSPQAPAKLSPKAKQQQAHAKAVGASKQKAQEDGFVTWLRESAPQRAARKASNAEMAAWLRSKGLVPNGAVWEAAKKGERSLKVLKAL